MARGLSDEYKKQINEDKLYLRTNIDGYFFDGFINIKQNHSLTVTSHPVQSGAEITDHAYKDPVVINAKIIISDAFVTDDKDREREANYFKANGATKSMGAFNVLKQLQAQRKLLTVVTPYGSYSNMLLTELAADYEYKNIYNVIADVILTEVIIANEKTVKVSARAQTTAESSPSPTVVAYNTQQEDKASEAVGKVLYDASKNEKSGVKYASTITHNEHRDLFSGSYDDLVIAVENMPSTIGQYEKKMTTASGKQILAVHATKGTYYSVELDTSKYDPSNELDY